MSQQYRQLFNLFCGTLIIISLSSWRPPPNENHYSLTVEASELRNSNGSIIFALYNRVDAFPDEHYKKQFKKLTVKIVNGSSSVTFENLPEAKYAINILHDENNDGKINKGLILAKEGIGFSNYETLDFSNRPSFKRASFNLSDDMKINVKVIYLSSTL